MIIRFIGGGRELGGNCVEITSNNESILLDVGMPIEKNYSEEITFRDTYAGILISHTHMDHYLRMEFLKDKKVNVYISDPMKDIFEANEIFLNERILNYKSFSLYESEEFEIGDFKITPYLQDHSSFDSQGFLIEVEGKKVFYTGDFRFHGRKSSRKENLISKLKEKDIDVLITDGTNISNNKINITEYSIQKKIMQEIKNTNGLVTVNFSSQNIDRIVSIYKASRKNNRTFIIDLYTAYLLMKLSKYAKLPNPLTYSHLRVYYPQNQICKVIKNHNSKILNLFRERSIYLDEVILEPNKYVFQIRPSFTEEVEKLTPTLNIYSMWEGYLEKEEYNKFKSHYVGNGISFKIIHTSGHISKTELKEFIEQVKPKKIFIIHTNSDLGEMSFSNVFYPENGFQIEI